MLKTTCRLHKRACPAKLGPVNTRHWIPASLHKKTCLLLALLLLLPLIVSACGYKEDSPEGAVTRFLTALKKLDGETAQKYCLYDEDDEDETSDGRDAAREFIEELAAHETNRLMLGRLRYKIVSSSLAGDTATVKTEITNIDLAEVLRIYTQQAMFVAMQARSEEELNAKMEQLFLDLLKRKDNKTVTSAVDIRLTRDEDGWKLCFDRELWNAVLGGLFSAFESPEESFQGLFPGLGVD